MGVPRLQHVASSSDPDGGWLDIGLPAGTEGGAYYLAHTGDSSWKVTIGDAAEDVQVIAFAHQHGVFTQRHGTRGRPIIWTGQLRLSSAVFAAVRTARDTWRKRGGRLLFKDQFGTTFNDCRLLNFEINEELPIQGETNLNFWAPYRIVLEQQLV